MRVTAKGKRVIVGTLGEWVRNYLDEAEITKPGACHLFRHTVATMMLENGADIRYIQELLGHSSITSTQIYTKVTINKLKEVYSRTHPKVNKRGRP